MLESPHVTRFGLREGSVRGGVHQPYNWQEPGWELLETFMMQASRLP